jgi:FAD/FMN-containing dehydrogenase
MGGAIGRVSPTDTAFGDRSAEYLVSAEAAWFQDSDAGACRAWARGFTADVEELPYSRGTYLNFNGETDATSRSAQFGTNIERLRGVKREYDPGNLFRMNNNIVP